MNKFYSEPNYKSHTVKDFLPKHLIDSLLETYFDVQKNVNRGRSKQHRITEIMITPGPNEFPFICTSKFNGIRKITYRKPIRITKSEIEEIKYILKQTTDADIDIEYLCIHNLHTPLSIHCDGIDVTNKTKNRSVEIDSFTDDHRPAKLRDAFNQGLITLKNDNPYNGTIIFDQWFPISTYILNTTEKNNKHKPMIEFFKGEKWERFGEHIRNATNTHFSVQDWNLLLSAVEDPTKLNKDDFFGLSTDEILYFGEPGTLNIWATKKYHASLPTADWSRDRINLQFETLRAK